MTLYIERADGRLVGSYFSIKNSSTEHELSNIDLGLFETTVPADAGIPDRCVTAFHDAGHIICVLARSSADTLLGLTVFNYTQEANWNDWNARTEEKRLAYLSATLTRSDIENGAHLPWGMANAYFDRRSGSSYLRVDYLSKHQMKLPDPMPYAPILP
jgi:hypothetical protein